MAKRHRKLTIEEATAAIRKAAAAGRIKLENPKNAPALKALEDAMREKRPCDHTLTKVEITGAWGPNKVCDGGFDIAWSSVSAGWGSFTFYRKKNGGWMVDNEAMSRDFLKEVLCKLADEIEFQP